ncbi:MAG TPA: SGNH/GDSL hydrolase family protein [Polyangiaceae bacterium]|nr:SGNH/GDSL hydrolase family protein [Polyangiaceae bacterium]
MSSLRALAVALVACVGTPADGDEARYSRSRSSPSELFEVPSAAAATGPGFRIVGRTSGTQSPRFQWSGVSIDARFRGRSIVADLDAGEDGWFQVVVDGKPLSRIGGVGGRRKYRLAEDLSLGMHEVVLWRLTEPDDEAPSTFYGLSAPGGRLLSPPVHAHALEVIGDSITCGYGAEDVDPCRFRYTTENNYAAYASVAARAVDADLHTECWSGKGMFRNYDGSTDEAMPALFARALPTDPKSRWDFSFVPDAVIVNLGTSDFHKGDPGRRFVTAYERFVSQLRERYPQAYLFVLIGPMLTGQSLQRAREYLDEVVHDRQTRGDARIRHIRVPPQEPRNGLGCYRHPTVETHRLMGEDLAAEMRAVLRW